MRFTPPLLALLLAIAPLSAAERPDILLADFEADTYGEGWKTTGTAFGKGPAKGTLPGQMPVSGYLGNGLVNSFLDGDKTTGTLTSPPFKIERKYINFLIGGGAHKGTRIDLIIDGRVIKTASGPNDQPGGSEALEWHSWDVGIEHDKTATIRIVDEEKGGWGHINIDHIVQSDAKKQAELKSRQFDTVDKKYLLLPVKNGAPKRRMTIVVRYDVRPKREQIKDVVEREFDIELAEGKPDFWVFADISAFKGKTIYAKTTLPAGSKSLDALKLSDELPDAEKVYQEKHRPLFHFTSRVGWLNDPNGLVYHNGEWHLFYQHNPFGREWGNMHWGHATSVDLFHWKEEGVALYPKKYGDWAFSGSAVFDKNNTSGFGTKEKPPLVLAYTSTGRGECIAFSSDSGRSWQEYRGNPVVKHAGRDPKLVWYEKGKHWVIAVYDEFQKKQWIAFYTSSDLKEWKFASRIEGFYECPDLFPLPLPNGHVKDGDSDTKWVLYAADGKYLLGDFDGKTFKPDFKEKKQLWYGNFYAAQTFDNAPRTLKANPFGLGIEFTGPRRRVQIGWARGVSFPGASFNQQMTTPVELQLLGGKEVILSAWPAWELENLREKKSVVDIDWDTKVAKRHLLGDNLDAFDLEIEIEPKRATGFTLNLRGTNLVYDAVKKTLTCKGVTAPVNLTCLGRLSLRVLVDRGSVEVFANALSEGFSASPIAMSIAAIPDEKNRTAELTAQGGEIIINWATTYRLKSAWEK